MSLLYPALQKFYNALQQLARFSNENSFYDNIGCIDTFLTEYRSSTFALQKSLGKKDHPIYTKNRDAYLKGDKTLSDWFIDQRNIVDHEHPFDLQRVLRIVIYDWGNAVVLKRYKQTVERNESVGDFFQAIRDTLGAIQIPEVCFSAQYLYVNDGDTRENDIFDFIEKGVVSMWRFLHAMKSELEDTSEVANDLMNRIDILLQKTPQRWMIDALDYCYYKSTDSFERGDSIAMLLPNIRTPNEVFMEHVRTLTSTVTTFFDAFVYFHTFAYIEQHHHLLSTFFVEYIDGTYQTISFSASIRTTMYRYVNRVSQLVGSGMVSNVYLVTETVGYGETSIQKIHILMSLNYKERMAYRQKTFLTFYKVSSSAKVDSLMMDADDLVDRLSVCTVISKIKTIEQPRQVNIMLTPIIRSFDVLNTNKH